MNRKGSILTSFLKLIIFLIFLAIVLKVSINYAEITLSEYFNRNEVEVPNFVEKSMQEAQEIARRVKLNVEIIERQHDNNVPIDHVVSQNPVPGVSVKSGRMVELIISEGANRTRCPSVIGKNVQAIPFVIQQAGFVMGVKSYIYSEDVKEGHVISQFPRGKDMAPQGSPVNFLVSSGKSTHSIAIPDFAGKRIEAARIALERLGLRLGDVGYRSKAGEKDFVILEQSPVALAKVSHGASVNLIVNRADAGNPVSPDGDRMEIVKFVVPPGTGPREVKMWLQDETGTREIYRNTHYPTEEIDITVSGVGEMKLFIYLDNSFFSEQELKSTN
jgi:serine/threonine-protein kinase